MLSDPLRTVAQQARDVYDAKFRSALEIAHHGEFACIDPMSQQVFLGKTFDEAVNRALDACPGRLTHTVRVGHSAALRLGAMSR